MDNYEQELQDLIYSLGSGESSSHSQYFTIDDATRKITPPNDFKYLGVESDSNSKRIWFECPRYVGDNIDLTELNVYINYQNANGDKDRWYAEDVTVDGDKIHFSWKLSRKALKYKGTVKFIVCAVETDGEGEKDPEWNTTLCTGTVLEGLEVENPEPDTPEYDIVNQLLSLWKEFRPADYNQNDPTLPDYIKHRPFYTDEKILAQQEIVTTGNPLACSVGFNEGTEVHDGDTISVEINNNGTVAETKIEISSDSPYFYTDYSGKVMSILFKRPMLDGEEDLDGYLIGERSTSSAFGAISFDIYLANEMLGKTVQILNPSPNTGEVKSVSATICGVDVDYFIVYFDPATMPAEMPFDVSNGFTGTIDSKYVVNGFAIKALAADGITVLAESNYSGATIKVSKEIVEKLDEKFIPNSISRKKDLDALFGHCIVTEILQGLTSGMNISLEYPLNFSAWSVWLADKKISGDLKPDETFVSASELFGNENITVKISAEKFVIVTTAVFVNRHKKVSWGTLQFVEIENI